MEESNSDVYVKFGSHRPFGIDTKYNALGARRERPLLTVSHLVAAVQQHPGSVLAQLDPGQILISPDKDGPPLDPDTLLSSIALSHSSEEPLHIRTTTNRLHENSEEIFKETQPGPSSTESLDEHLQKLQLDLFQIEEKIRSAEDDLKQTQQAQNSAKARFEKAVFEEKSKDVRDDLRALMELERDAVKFAMDNLNRLQTEKLGLRRKEEILLLTQKDLLLREKLSPMPLSKENFIERIKFLLPGIVISDGLLKLLRTNKDFYHRLHGVMDWDRADAKRFIEEAKLYLCTSTKRLVMNHFGYRFGETLTYLGQRGTLIVNVYSPSGHHCAKIGSFKMIQKEAEIARRLKGPCVMPILDVLDLGQDRGALISPLYGETVGQWLIDSETGPSELDILSLLFSGLSAIHSFASQGLCHCDIKLQNLVCESRTRIILVDFGSATNLGDCMTSTTSGIAFGWTETSIRYDLASLVSVVGCLMLGEGRRFVTLEQLLGLISPLKSRFPIVVESIQKLRLNEEIQSVEDLIQRWRDVFPLAVHLTQQDATAFSHWSPVC